MRMASYSRVKAGGTSIALLTTVFVGGLGILSQIRGNCTSYGILDLTRFVHWRLDYNCLSSLNHETNDNGLGSLEIDPTSQAEAYKQLYNMANETFEWILVVEI